jgi:hypothetical protein
MHMIGPRIWTCVACVISQEGRAALGMCCLEGHESRVLRPLAYVAWHRCGFPCMVWCAMDMWRCASGVLWCVSCM